MSRELATVYKRVAEKYSCGFIDAQRHIRSSELDGFHLDAEGHRVLAAVIGAWITDATL